MNTQKTVSAIWWEILILAVGIFVFLIGLFGIAIGSVASKAFGFILPFISLPAGMATLAISVIMKRRGKRKGDKVISKIAYAGMAIGILDILLGILLWGVLYLLVLLAVL